MVGKCFDAYRVLGAHPCRDDFGQEGWRFAVWAPEMCIRDRVYSALVHAAVGVALPIKGTGDGIHPDAIAVVDIHPEGSGAVQEAAHLPAVIVEVAGAPLTVAHIAVVLVEVDVYKRQADRKLSEGPAVMMMSMKSVPSFSTPSSCCLSTRCV